jgi:hypothetical protein
MALVVYTFATVLMMSEGIRATLVATGRPDNVIALRKGSPSEISSGVDRTQAAVLASLPGIARGADGQRLASAETVVLNALPKKDSAKAGNLTMRGTSAAGLALRPQVQLVAGRMFRPGSAEIIVGRAVSDGFAGAAGPEPALCRPRVAHRRHRRRPHRLRQRDLGRCGRDDAGLPPQRLLGGALAPGRPDGFARQQAVIAADPRLTVEAKPEVQFYEEQSQALATFIRILGTALSIIFSIGAVVGAMITMFAAVSQRTAEIGTLRALGFRRGAVLVAFLGESLLLALVGGLMAWPAPA